MLLTISTTHDPATDLGFLLHKHPDNVHERKLSFGRAVLFYPEATEERCTAAMVLDVDPVGLVRRKGRPGTPSLFDHYVTDRPFAVSSFMSVAISRLLSTAMSGRSRSRQNLAETALPLEVTLTPLPVRGDEGVLDRLFTPLGYAVVSERLPLDPAFPDWGDSPYRTVTLNGTVKLADLLTHLFVLIPVLDNQKHYWVGKDEIDKLLAKGQPWLDAHPEQDFIVKRYLRRQRSLVRVAMDRIAESAAPEDEEALEVQTEAEEVLEKPIRLNDQRMDTVVGALKGTGARSVVDLGCSEGKLLQRLLKVPQFQRILGIDVSTAALERATRRLRLERLSPRQAERIDVKRGSLVYVDERLEGFDAIALVEVIEHVEPDRLGDLEHVVFATAKPHYVVVTTPNREYNAVFENQEPDRLRHPDHRFEWTRDEFAVWANGVAERNGYSVHIDGIGEAHADFGPPTQMGIFSR